MTALLEAASARIDVDGAVALEALSLSVDGTRVGLIGDWSALFGLLGGTARLASGTLTLGGVDATSAVASGAVGLGALDPPLHAEALVERWLWEGARLAGFARRETRDAVKSALSVLNLSHLSARRFGTLTLAEKRAVVLAQALIGAPPMLALEDPCARLDERGVALVSEVVERAAQERALLMSCREAPASGPERTLLESADALVWLERGTLVARGRPSEVLVASSRYLVSVTKNGERLIEKLSGLGLGVHLAHTSGGFAPLSLELAAASGGALRMLVDLPDAGGTAAILDAALEVDSPVLELRPLAGIRAPEPSAGESA